VPFTDVIFTPSCFKKDIGKKQIRYNGYHELAYLHPNYFTPNPAVLDEMGLSKEDTFIILRFVSWRASHDVGQHGIKNKIELVRELEKYGRVFITSEGKLEKDLEEYRIKVSPEKLHDLLYYASLYVGEGATMATESAVLGTPSIYISSLVGTMGNFIELEQKYGLIFNYNDSDKAIEKAVELIQKQELKEMWREKREKLLKDKIDVTAFMVWLIENYPESFKEMQKNSGYHKSRYTNW
jgi:predicted glycosyltransferase